MSREQKHNEEMREEERASWRSKPLHSISHWQIKVTDIKKTYQWMDMASLKDSMEALIKSPQDQVLNTRSIEAGVSHTTQ